MSAFFAFLKKEYTESLRSGKFMLLGILFVAIGIMNPAVAKLTPWLLETMSESLEETGMSITAVTVDAMTSWTQFFKNIPMMLIAYVLIYAGAFTKEYEAGTLVLILTKGIARYKILLSKTLWLISYWTVGYFASFGITYGYTAYYWDNSIAKDLFPAVLCWFLFSLLVICLMVLFSTLGSTSSAVMMGTGAVVLASYLLSFFPKLVRYLPTSLMNGMAILTGAETVEHYMPAIILSGTLCIICIAGSIPIMNKKQL